MISPFPLAQDGRQKDSIIGKENDSTGTKYNLFLHQFIAAHLICCRENPYDATTGDSLQMSACNLDNGIDHCLPSLGLGV